MGLFASLAILLLAASPAVAADEGEKPKRRSYVEMQAGYSYIPYQTLAGGGNQSRIEPTVDDAFNVGFAIGRRIGDMFRLEGAVNFREGSIDDAGLISTAPADGKISLVAGMLNGYVDLDLDSKVIPYVGFGIGIGEFEIDISQETNGDFEIDDPDIVFVYNAMAGVTIELTRTAELNFGYRYVAIPSNTTTAIIGGTQSQSIDSEFDAHEAVAGLRFNF